MAITLRKAYWRHDHTAPENIWGRCAYRGKNLDIYPRSSEERAANLGRTYEIWLYWDGDTTASMFLRHNILQSGEINAIQYAHTTGSWQISLDSGNGQYGVNFNHALQANEWMHLVLRTVAAGDGSVSPGYTPPVNALLVNLGYVGVNAKDQASKNPPSTFPYGRNQNTGFQTAIEIPGSGTSWRPLRIFGGGNDSAKRNMVMTFGAFGSGTQGTVTINTARWAGGWAEERLWLNARTDAEIIQYQHDFVPTFGSQPAVYVRWNDIRATEQDAFGFGSISSLQQVGDAWDESRDPGQWIGISSAGTSVPAGDGVKFPANKVASGTTNPHSGVWPASNPSGFTFHPFDAGQTGTIYNTFPDTDFAFTQSGTRVFDPIRIEVQNFAFSNWATISLNAGRTGSNAMSFAPSVVDPGAVYVLAAQNEISTTSIIGWSHDQVENFFRNGSTTLDFDNSATHTRTYNATASNNYDFSQLATRSWTDVETYNSTAATLFVFESDGTQDVVIARAASNDFGFTQLGERTWVDVNIYDVTSNTTLAFDNTNSTAERSLSRTGTNTPAFSTVDVGYTWIDVETFNKIASGFLDFSSSASATKEVALSAQNLYSFGYLIGWSHDSANTFFRNAQNLVTFEGSVTEGAVMDRTGSNAYDLTLLLIQISATRDKTGSNDYDFTSTATRVVLAVEAADTDFAFTSTASAVRIVNAVASTEYEFSSSVPFDVDSTFPALAPGEMSFSTSGIVDVTHYPELIIDEDTDLKLFPVKGGADVATVDIWNIALVALGHSTVDSTSDTGRAGLLLQDVWPEFRKQFLNEHPWAGAKTTQALSRFQDTSPAGDVNPTGTRWNFAYQLPDDTNSRPYLHALYINGLPVTPQQTGSTNQWEIEAVENDAGTIRRCILTNATAVDLEYVFDPGDTNIDLLSTVTKYALGLALAVHIAANFGKDANERQILAARAEEALQKAKGTDGQESSHPLFQNTPLLDARGYPFGWH